MFVDLLIAISCGIAGLTCGWIAYPSLLRATSDRPVAEPDLLQPVTNSSDVADATETQNRLTEIANRLSLLTASVTASVHQHASELENATKLVRQVELTRDPKTLLQAMNQLIDASEIMRDQLASAENKLVEQNLLLQTAEASSYTDPLTQIANRRALDVHLEACVAAREQTPATLMIVDIDHFKNFNDQYGHIAGDQLLKRIAGFLHKQLGHVGIVARYGGEEFVIVFDGKPMTACVDLAEATRSQIGQQEIVFQNQTLTVTASMGLAELISDARERDSAEHWLHRADKALYKSKQFRDCGHVILNDLPVRVHTSSQASSERNQSAASPSTSQGTEPTGNIKLPKGLKGLISGDQMHLEFNSLSQEKRGVGLSFVTAVVQIDKTQSSLLDLQFVARSCRSVLRSVDRIGLLDERTLVIAMPGVDHESAVQRADRIRANIILAAPTSTSTSDDQARDYGTLTVSIALSSSSERAAFSDMLRLSQRLLQRQHATHVDQTLTAW